MDKQKQIEEMANVLCESKAHNCNGEDCKCIKQAKDLYNADCRILDKGSVVLSKEENEKWLDFLEMNITKARKETAKAVFERVKYFFLNECTIASDFNLFAALNEIAKEFGVEL